MRLAHFPCMCSLLFPLSYFFSPPSLPLFPFPFLTCFCRANGSEFEAPFPKKLNLEVGDVVSFGFSAYSKRLRIPLNPHVSVIFLFIFLLHVFIIIIVNYFYIVQIYRKRLDVIWGDMENMFTERRLTST